MKIDAKTVSAIVAALASTSYLFAGELILPAKEAVIHGTAQHGPNAIVGWNNPNTTVSWHVKVERGEEVEVFVDQACPSKVAGSTYQVRIGDQSISGITQPTENWGAFKSVSLGKVTVQQTGSLVVEIVPNKLSGSVFANIASVKIKGDQFTATLQDPYQPVPIALTETTQEGAAVFYPQGMDKADVPPSLALARNLTVTGNKLPEKWPVQPEFKNNGKHTLFDLPLEEGTSVYGMGEVRGALERSNTEVVLWNTDAGGYTADGGRRLYQSHPWILCVRKDGSAYGVLIDTTYRTVIKIGEEIRCTTEAPDYRVLVIDRASPQEVMQGLADLTGTMELPPMWALGFQQCRWSYFPDTRVKEIADGLRERKIPCDVIWMDIDYMDKFRIFTFDKERFPDPKGLNGYLHDNGFKGVWMIDPGVFVDPDYWLYQEGTEKGMWVTDKDGNEYHGRVWPGQCAFPDYTRADVAQWWAGLYTDFMAHGIDGVWNDMNEPVAWDHPGGTMFESNLHGGGLTLPTGEKMRPGNHAQYHNVYGMLMARATREGILKANPEKRPFVLTRASYLGGQRYAATWTGDNKSEEQYLKWSIPMSLNFGLSGQPFSGPDIGGFFGNATPDLFGHWMAVGAFYPFSRAHSAKGSKNHEPWSFGPEVEQASRTAMERRYRLMPYIYTLFREASVNGQPVMRPVFFADPANAALRKEDQAFLLGGDLLVIPKWAKNPAIPAGFNQSISLVGEDTVGDKYQCDLKIRDGAIVPLTKVMQSTAEFDHNDVTLMVRLDQNGKAEGKLYEDKNDGFGYHDGAFRPTRFTAERKHDRIVITQQITDGKMEPLDRNIAIEIILGDSVSRYTLKSTEKMTIKTTGNAG
ncbi:MAG: TIM-barrel domain-containing protein [Kiritimatiellia bacterium]